jgi:hypothetical protein
MFDFAEVALEAAAGPVGSLGHDVEDGGMGHGALGYLSRRFGARVSVFIILPGEGGPSDLTPSAL